MRKVAKSARTSSRRFGVVWAVFFYAETEQPRAACTDKCGFPGKVVSSSLKGTGEFATGLSHAPVTDGGPPVPPVPRP
jgi:hypothetical protein